MNFFADIFQDWQKKKRSTRLGHFMHTCHTWKKKIQQKTETGLGQVYHLLNIVAIFFQTLDEEKNHRKERKDANKAAIERAKDRADPDRDNFTIKFELTSRIRMGQI
jgi:hypothetical protein